MHCNKMRHAISRIRTENVFNLNDIMQQGLFGQFRAAEQATKEITKLLFRDVMMDRAYQ
jgi:hypothetical protein